MFRLTIFDRYLMRQLLLYAGFALLIFTIVWIAPEILLEAIQAVGAHQLTVWQGLLYVLYQLPEVFLYSIPIAAMVSSLFFFRRFSLSSELTAVQVSGVSMPRILRPVAFVGLLLSVAFFFNQECLAPSASHAFNQLRFATGLKKESPADNFLTLTETAPDGSLAYFRLFSKVPKPNELALLSVGLVHSGQTSSSVDSSDSSNGVGIQQLIAAKQAVWSPQASAWDLKNATVYDVSSDGVYKKITPYEQLALPSTIKVQDFMAFSYQLPIEMTLGQLFEHIRILEVMNQWDQARYYHVRFFQRFLNPIAPLVLMLISVGFAVERARARRNIGLLIAVILLIFYNIAISVMTSLGGLGILPAFLAAAMPLILVTLLATGVTRFRRIGG